MELVHANIGSCGQTSATIGSGYKLKYEKSEFAITRPNEISSLLIQAQVRVP